MNSSLTPEQRSEILLSNIATSDCGVIAFQAVTKAKRPVAEREMKRAGYKPETGTPRGAIEKALRKRGYKTKDAPDFRQTPATFASTHEYGVYLVYTDRHVMALVEGDLHNSRGHWHSPVEAITEVTK